MVWAKNEIALCSARAEYVVLSIVIKEVISIMQSMNELINRFQSKNSNQGTQCHMFEDNASKSYKLSPKTKHKAIKYHYFWIYVDEEKIVLNWMDTKEQMVDIFT